MGKILVIDDEESLRSILSRLLTLEDYKVLEAGDAKEAMSIIEREEVQVIISDVKLPDANGVELVPKLKERLPLCEIIVLTAYGTIQDGVQAIKSGAFDYITKGDEDNKIIPLVQKAMEKAQLRERIEQLENRISEKFSFDKIIGADGLLKDAVNMARRVSSTDAPVLLIGETGTGKEIFAQSIHNSGQRKNNAFVAVNCSAFAKELLESEMFGYKAGAFTGAVKNKKGLFEEAHEGTLFLDEIGELDISLQAKLLRVLETNSFIKQGDTKPTSVNVRIIAATNKDLEEEISKGNFRSDLYYRISVMKIEIPPLRKHKEDIQNLAESFIKEYSLKLKRNIVSVDEEFIEKLKAYNFPGNIRELRNIIERAVILTECNIIGTESLPSEFNRFNRLGETKEIKTSLPSLEEIEKQHILDILNQVSGNKTRAAEILGIGITTLYRKLQSYGLE
ncbi:MAG: sigma-54 dependent transcriptional regulator [Bacteroidota bacterium]|nr:sigma-54 dependent transcriptional regulator [Bacteroidota bacterium]MDP4190355.1 sigma-54 dependent transcriptional regulator [Bacteroidota bacterium]MDP4193517.1 sigma-54 dependent transcriptional regulator [Bacteroidota bacterium]